MILTQMLLLSRRTLHLNLVIEASLTSSFLLMQIPSSHLGLQISSQGTKEIPLTSLGHIFEVRRNFILILSRSSLSIFVCLKQFMTCRGKLVKLAFRTILPAFRSNCVF